MDRTYGDNDSQKNFQDRATRWLLKKIGLREVVVQSSAEST